MSDPSESRRPLIGLAVVFAVLALGGGLFFYLRSASESVVEGSLTVGDAAFTPTHCRSGRVEEDGPRDLPRFAGVDLIDASGRTVRVLDDPTDGETVVVRDPGAPPRSIDRAACSRFEVSLHETGELIMEVWGMDGSVDLACPGARGQVRFSSCFSGR